MELFQVIFLGLMFIFTFWFLVVRGFLTLLDQHAAESFPHVQGTVLTSVVTTTRSSKGHTFYHPYITYQYTVDGVNYTGSRYRYDGHPNDSNSANEIVSAHPPDSIVDVYYNSQDPADVVLSIKVDSGDVTMLLFMTPMTLFFLLLLLQSAREVDWPWNHSQATGGVKVITEMLVTRVRLPRFQPASVGLLMIIVLFIVAAVLVNFVFTSMQPWVAGEWSLAWIFLGGCAAYAWQYLDIHSGKRDLVIDESTQTILLPLTYGRRERMPISLSQVRAVFLNKVRHQTKNGVYYTYMVTLDMADNSGQKLVNLNQKRAESLAAWLKEKLRLASDITTRQA